MSKFQVGDRVSWKENDDLKGTWCSGVNVNPFGCQVLGVKENDIEILGEDNIIHYCTPYHLKLVTIKTTHLPDFL